MNCYRLFAGSVVLVFFCSACQQGTSPGNPTTAVPQETSTTIVETGPSKVELGQPTYRMDGMIIHFEIPYKFTEGSPVKYYTCDVEFPGTKNSGTRPLEGWELKPEGIIKASFELSAPTELTTYEVTFSEAESPDRGYKLVSNKVTGEFPRPASKDEKTDEKPADLPPEKAE